MAPVSDRQRKPPVIRLCSSSSSKSSEDSSDDDEVEEISGDESSYSNNEEEDDGGGEEEEEEGEGEDEDEESLCERVISLLKEGNGLEGLYVKHCKAYLRKYGLRLAGTKAVCIQRIKEHWRFSKVTRHGEILGMRTVAGRIVKESYGSAKQQHTFSVEVLWSKGVEKLPPLSPLLVKGRNLYKLRTFRQCWDNEAERQKVLAEKHERGAAARRMRTTRKSKMTWSENGGDAKCHNRSHHGRPSQSRKRKTAELEKRKHVDVHGRDTLQLRETYNKHHQQPLAQLDFNRNMNLHGSKTPLINVDMGPTLQARAFTTQDPCISQVEPHQRRVPFHPSLHDRGTSTTVMTLPPWRPYADTVPAQYQGLSQNSRINYDYANPCISQVEPHQRSVPFHPSLHDRGTSTTLMTLPPWRPYADTVPAQYQGLSQNSRTNYDYANPCYNFERSLNHTPDFINSDRPLHRFPQRIETPSCSDHMEGRGTIKVDASFKWKQKEITNLSHGRGIKECGLVNRS
ncbi:unnamed protein product [Dovyalis caffra]|uniref:DUF7699 domain-containing protein n=1 Tax=Dovyalis caffra TaxID=77055 RepID=A0AAV1RLP6_9ROSI|nr:unnamed protein product [Dovyalis caffra]